MDEMVAENFELWMVGLKVKAAEEGVSDDLECAGSGGGGGGGGISNCPRMMLMSSDGKMGSTGKCLKQRGVG